MAQHFVAALCQLQHLMMSGRYPAEIEYSKRGEYMDDKYEYRFVTLPFSIAKRALMITEGRKLLSESQCRELGIVQSPGWSHFVSWSRELHVLPFRRPLPESVKDDVSVTTSAEPVKDDANVFVEVDASVPTPTEPVNPNKGGRRCKNLRGAAGAFMAECRQEKSQEVIA